MSRVIQHLVREQCKSQGARVGAVAGSDSYRVVQKIVREPRKSKGDGVGADASLDSYRVEEPGGQIRGRFRPKKEQGDPAPDEGVM